MVGLGIGVAVGVLLVGAFVLVGGRQLGEGGAQKGAGPGAGVGAAVDGGDADGVGMVALSPIRSHHNNPMAQRALVDERFAAPANRQPPPGPPRRPTGAMTVVGEGTTAAYL